MKMTANPSIPSIIISFHSVNCYDVLWKIKLLSSGLKVRQIKNA